MRRIATYVICTSPRSGSTLLCVHALDVNFDNSTDDHYYVVKAFADTPAEEAILTHGFIIVVPGEKNRVGAGPDPRQSESLCFENEQFRVLRSLSGAPYWRTWEDTPERTLEDLEIVHHLGPDTCLPDGEITVKLT